VSASGSTFCGPERQEWGASPTAQNIRRRRQRDQISVASDKERASCGPSKTIRILSSAEKCRRVARRISLTTCSAGFFVSWFSSSFWVFRPSDETRTLLNDQTQFCATGAEAGHSRSAAPRGRFSKKALACRATSDCFLVLRRSFGILSASRLLMWVIVVLEPSAPKLCAIMRARETAATLSCPDITYLQSLR
jgi:hypothetical protein